MRNILFIFICLSLFFTPNAQTLKFPYKTTYASRNDTVFVLSIYPDKLNPDSIIVSNYALKIRNNKSLIMFSDNSFKIVKFRKIKSSTFFEKYLSPIYDQEYMITSSDYYHDDYVFIWRNFRLFSIYKTKKIKPKYPLQITP